MIGVRDVLPRRGWPLSPGSRPAPVVTGAAEISGLCDEFNAWAHRRRRCNATGTVRPGATGRAPRPSPYNFIGKEDGVHLGLSLGADPHTALMPRLALSARFAGFCGNVP